jgi:metallo-beta-lactamase family protein
MNIRVKFLGGAQSVTGSKYLLEIDDFKLMIDCGLFQGLKELRSRNWDELPIDCSEIDAVALTHTHIDHIGYLPKLFKSGFAGKVYCTVPTADLVEILLLDSAKLQEEEADFANRKGYSKHNPAEPLYKVKDTEIVFTQLEEHEMGDRFSLSEEIELRFFQAGHVLGAASIEVIVKTSQGEKVIVFSGDIGPDDNPLHFAPEKPKKADILFIETTYGGRNHHHENIEEELNRILNHCEEKGGCLVIPAFSLGRTQLLLYYLWKVFQNRPDIPVYLDSPMAIKITALYKQYAAYHRLQSNRPFGHTIFDAPFIHYVTEQSQSRTLNMIRDKAIIISASGMATGGRILHHLYHRLPKEQDTILFTGFMAKGTRGRNLMEGAESVKIFGEEVDVKARIENLDGLSAHADQSQLLNWLSELKDPPKKTFLIHGEIEANQEFQNLLRKRNWDAIIPEYLETVTLFDHI